MPITLNLIIIIQTQFQVGGTTLLIKDGQVMATGGGGVQDVNMKQVWQKLIRQFMELNDF